MGWIAKNSITGQTYGKEFDSIYDCQLFIDKKLIVLEYEMQRCFSLEKDIIRDIDNEGKSLIDYFLSMFHEFEEESGVKEQVGLICDSIFFKDKQVDVNKKLNDISTSRWLRNNIIRCWYVDQSRFADGMDF